MIQYTSRRLRRVSPDVSYLILLRWECSQEPVKNRYLLSCTYSPYLQRLTPDPGPDLPRELWPSIQYLSDDDDGTPET